MSDVSKTNAELIAEAREFASRSYIGKTTARELDKAILMTRRLADALDAATRVPVQGEPNGDREVLEHIRTTRARQRFLPNDDREALIDKIVMTDLSDFAGTDMSMINAAADAILAAGFSRATVPDAATKRVAELEATVGHLKAALDGREASPQEWSLLERLEDATDAIERVRARLQPTLGGTPTGEFAEVCGCGNSYFPCDHAAAILAALDGAPEPEVKP